MFYTEKSLPDHKSGHFQLKMSLKRTQNEIKKELLEYKKWEIKRNFKTSLSSQVEKWYKTFLKGLSVILSICKSLNSFNKLSLMKMTAEKKSL